MDSETLTLASVLAVINNLTQRTKREHMATTIKHYQDLGDFDYGTSDHQVSPLIRRVICKPHTVHIQGNGYLFSRARMLQSSTLPPLESHLDDILSALEPGEAVTHSLITHTHSDHSLHQGNGKERTGAISMDSVHMGRSGRMTQRHRS